MGFYGFMKAPCNQGKKHYNHPCIPSLKRRGEFGLPHLLTLMQISPFKGETIVLSSKMRISGRFSSSYKYYTTLVGVQAVESLFINK